jgi:hypothetical protein
MDMDDEEPAQGMPTIEEVREWRAAQIEAARRGIMANLSAEGVADIFRMAEAEEYYQMLGLL